MDKEGIKSAFAKRLTALRIEKDLSIRALANQAGLEFSQVQRIEKGKVNPALTTIIALANGLGVHPSELLLVGP